MSVDIAQQAFPSQRIYIYILCAGNAYLTQFKTGEVKFLNGVKKKSYIYVFS